jgi:hypothetical protein
MVKKLGILGFILIVVAAASMVWAGTQTGGIPAPQPTVMPAAAPPVCAGGFCGVPVVAPPPPQMKVKKGPMMMPPKSLITNIKVKMSYPQYPPPPCPPIINPCAPPPPPPIPVAVPMWKFVVPWPPFVYYLPVD